MLGKDTQRFGGRRHDEIQSDTRAAGEGMVDACLHTPQSEVEGLADDLQRSAIGAGRVYAQLYFEGEAGEGSSHLPACWSGGRHRKPLEEGSSYVTHPVADWNCHVGYPMPGRKDFGAFS